MYKEISKLFDIKIPVQHISTLTEYYVNRQTSYNPQLKQQVDYFKTLFKNEFDNDIKSFLNQKFNFQNLIIQLIENLEIIHTIKNHKFSNKSNNGKNEIVSFLQHYDKKQYDFIGFDVKEGSFNALKLFLHGDNFGLKSDFYPDEKLSIDFINSKTFIDGVKILLDNVKHNFSNDFINVILSSKHFRQVIFGNIFPKKARNILSFFVNLIDEKLQKKYILKTLVTSQDEMLYAVKKEYSYKLKEDIQKEIDFYDNLLRMDNKELVLIDNIQSNPKNDVKQFYYEINNNMKKLKTVPKDFYFPLFVKYILEEDYITKDLLYESNGNIFQWVFLNELDLS